MMAIIASIEGRSLRFVWILTTFRRILCRIFVVCPTSVTAAPHHHQRMLHCHRERRIRMSVTRVSCDLTDEGRLPLSLLSSERLSPRHGSSSNLVETIKILSIPLQLNKRGASLSQPRIFPPPPTTSAGNRILPLHPVTQCGFWIKSLSWAIYLLRRLWNSLAWK